MVSSIEKRIVPSTSTSVRNSESATSASRRRCASTTRQTDSAADALQPPRNDALERALRDPRLHVAHAVSLRPRSAGLGGVHRSQRHDDGRVASELVRVGPELFNQRRVPACADLVTG
jgi:hypothetical protein